MGDTGQDIFKSSITKCADGKYRVDYSYRSPDGKRHRTCKRGFKLQREATKWQREELPKLIKQLGQEKTLDENLTMEELIKEYIEYTKIRRRSSTVENKTNIIKTKICPYFSWQKVYSVSKNDVREWQDKLLALTKPNGEPYSTTYIRSINNQLSAILSYAVTYHNLPSNPVVQIERIGTKQPEEERQFWTLEEYTKFSEAIQDKPEFYYAFQVFFWCGLRMGELRALTKEDIDLENRTLRIINSYSKEEKTKGKTKTKNSKRIVHMPQALADELGDYLDSLYGLEATEPVFPVSKSDLHRVMTSGSEKAGVKRITIHGLRHSHISLLMNYVSCASVMDIAKRAGHKSPDITMIYSHRYSNKDEIIADQLDGMMKGGSVHVGEE